VVLVALIHQINLEIRVVLVEAVEVMLLRVLVVRAHLDKEMLVEMVVLLQLY
jgi:hypothetical protein